MDKKSTLILLSILHICILGICILTIYSNRHSGVTVAHISSDTKMTVSLNEPQTVAHTESAAGTPPETYAEAETETGTGITTKTESELTTETQTEPASEVYPQPGSTILCTFHFIGTHKNLNIRSAPSVKAKVIGKIPVGGSGSVLELTNNSWALIEYNGITGYCSRGWIELLEIKE